MNNTPKEKAKDRDYLINMYNATSTDDGTGNDELETYEAWLERQLLSRIEALADVERQKIAFAIETLKSYQRGNTAVYDMISLLEQKLNP